MKTIQILGTGCAKCSKLAEEAQQAADTLGLDYQLEKVTDMMRFVEFGVMVTPAMVVDGEVLVTGKVPTQDELQAMLKD